MTGLEMSRCTQCRLVHFPQRQVCPGCHGVTFVAVHAERGRVEELTSTATATVASVRTDRGPVVVAALTDPDVVEGADVTVSATRGAAAAYVPVGPEETRA